jgi:hypothetical protein
VYRDNGASRAGCRRGTERAMTDAVVDFEAIEGRVTELAGRFRAAEPYPHLVVENLLRPEAIRTLEAEFPRRAGDTWTHYRHYNNNTLGLTRFDALPPAAQAAVGELNSPRFCTLLSAITGFDGLLADEMLEGGGLHMTEAGGFLNLHADFTNHHYHARWQRRCNLIVFVNSDWQDEWGGALELWERDLSRCRVRVPVRSNLAVLFETARDTFHGYPDPLTCPAGATRKSLALYYYTEEDRVEARSTNYRARPGEGVTRRVLTAADRTLLNLYTRAKQTFGLSDDFASRWLRRLGRRRD